MSQETAPITRRVALAGLAGAAALAPSAACADDDIAELVQQLLGQAATESDRLHLAMPRQFPTGSTVPLAIEIDSAMTTDDHVRQVTVLAPRNPIIEVACFHFAPQRSAARIATRIRLAGPQHVVAVAEMQDGALLMARCWVEPATNGCS